MVMVKGTIKGIDTAAAGIEKSWRHSLSSLCSYTTLDSSELRAKTALYHQTNSVDKA